MRFSNSRAQRANPTGAMPKCWRRRLRRSSPACVFRTIFARVILNAKCEETVNAVGIPGQSVEEFRRSARSPQ